MKLYGDVWIHFLTFVLKIKGPYKLHILCISKYFLKLLNFKDFHKFLKS